MKKIRLGLFDGVFSGKSCSYNQETAGMEPEHIEWVRGEYLPVTFFTDTNLQRVKSATPGTRCFAWLLEPYEFSPNAYMRAFTMAEHFEAIFTHDARFLGGNWKYLPYCGSWIKEWGLFPKTKNVSMIISGKSRTFGHKLRKHVREAFEDYVDVFGYMGIPLEGSKAPALRPYRYSIVIESGNAPGYFSEKLIDCVSQGTVPIYWGATDLIACDGIHTWPFYSLKHLGHILDHAMENVYNRQYLESGCLAQSIEIARNFRCVEDVLYERYGSKIAP